MTVRFNRNNSGIFQNDASVYSVFHGTDAHLLEDELNESQWMQIERLATQIREQYSSGFLKSITVQANGYSNFFAVTSKDSKPLSLFLDGYLLKVGGNDPGSLPAGLTSSDDKLIFKLNPSGSATRTDLVILEAWFEVMDHNEILKKFGGTDTTTIQNNMLDSRANIETSRRTQFRWRVRSINSTTDITQVDAMQYDGVVSTTKYAALGDIFIANTGVKRIVSNLKTPGLVYGVPLFKVSRPANDNVINNTNLSNIMTVSKLAVDRFNQRDANVKDFGAIGNGINDDSASVISAISSLQNANGGTLFFPQGTYNLATWVPYIVNYPITIVGTDYTKIIGIKGSNAVTFLKPKANININNISIDGFYDCLDFSEINTIVDYINIEKVNFTNYKHAALLWLEINLVGGVKIMHVENCTIKGDTIIPSYGIQLSTPIYEKMEIHGNFIDNLTERGIYLGSNTLALQDSRESVNITRNNVGNIYNSYGSVAGQEDFNSPAGEGKRAANGIQVLATNAIISDNYIYDIDNYAKQDGEGIYTKCKYAVIASNHLINAGGSEAFIDIKGSGRVNSKQAQCTAQTNVNVLVLDTTQYIVNNGSIDIFDSLGNLKYNGRKVTAIDAVNKSITISGSPVTTLTTDYVAKAGRAKGYGTIVSNNKLLDNRPINTSPTPGSVTAELPAGNPISSTGIKLNTDDVKCEGNIVEGMTGVGITVGGSSYSNIDIRGNKVRRIRGYGGISVAGTGLNFVVDNNQIIDVFAEHLTNTPYGISVGGTVRNVVISNNQIDNIIAGVNAGIPCGVTIAPGNLAGGKNNITTRNNNINNTTRGIYFRGLPADDVLIVGNKIQNVTLPIYYGDIPPLNLVFGQNYPTLQLPSPIDPSAVAGLYSWFDASSITGLIDGNAVPIWNDKSANAAHATQATVANQPIYTTNSLSGKPAISFNGTTQNLKTAVFTTAMTQPNTIFLVASLTSGYLFDGLTAAGREYFRNNGTYYYINAGATLGTSVSSDANFHLFTLRVNGVNSSIKVDSAVKIGDAAGATPTALDGLTLGSLYNATGAATGKICELIIYGGDINSYNSSRIEDYLKNKWGI